MVSGDLFFLEETGDIMKYETKEKAQAAIDVIAGMNYSKIKEMTIKTNPYPGVHDKYTRKRANEIINKTDFFEMKMTTDPPFKVRKFENVKTWVDYILGTKDEKTDEK